MRTMRLRSKAKAVLKRLLNARGLQIRKEPGLIDFLRSRGIETVLDVGANTGQFATGLREIGYTGRIVSFEPVSEVFDALVRHAAGDEAWDVRQLALGDRNGQAEIKVSRNPVFSSILPQTDLATTLDSDAEVVRTEVIRLARLDDIFDEFQSGHVFLKIDTQGFEAAVIEGARDALTRILGVQMELPIEHLYQGVWSFEEAIALMRRKGFTLAQLRPAVALAQDPASFAELDCVFRRAEA